MSRTIVAVLSLTALLLTSGCGRGTSQAETTPATTAKSVPAVPATTRPQPGGGPASVDVVAAKACRAMATMLDTWDSDYSAVYRFIPPADPHDLLTELQPVLAAKPKWAALAAGLAATAAAAAKLSSITDFPMLIQESGPMFADGAKAADECAKLPAAAKAAAWYRGWKRGASLGLDYPARVYMAMSDGITRMGVDPNISNEVRPGTYMTDGGTGPDCHWAKLRSNDPNDIVQKGQGTGVQTVAIDSPYFKSERCGVWWMVGTPRP